MSDEILTGIAADLEDAKESRDTAASLIAAMKEAGEDVSAQEADLRALSMRMNKWEKMLASRGITV